MSSAHTLHSWLGIDLRWAYGELLASIWRQTRCVHRAQDVLHDAFVRLALRGPRETIAQPHAYLRTVVRSVLVDHGKEAARYLAYDFTTPDVDDAAANTAHWPDGTERLALPSAEHLADMAQRLRAVQQILDCLPPRCREVFWLFRVEGHSQADIAQHLGISLNMVERHVMRALIDLRAAREALL